MITTIDSPTKKRLELNGSFIEFGKYVNDSEQISFELSGGTEFPGAKAKCRINPEEGWVMEISDGQGNNSGVTVSPTGDIILSGNVSVIGALSLNGTSL